jgi:NAD(P)-dependent dehydrogenase (short-subunit alcohol dehydrogenase family)
MTSASLEGRRVLIVGASSGIGRALAVRAVQDGAEVAMVARTAEKLAETVALAGGGVAIAADLRADGDCDRIAAETVAAIGSPELVFVSAGSSALQWVHQTTRADWARAFETNVIGVNLLFGALRPHLRAGSIVAACSSESVGRPRAAMVPYSSSKAALEESLRGWRVEHPDLRFTCVSMGATMPTGFADTWDMDLLMQALDTWASHGLAQAEMMEADDVAEMLAATFALALALPGIGLEQLTLRSPAKAGASNDEMLGWAQEHGFPTPDPDPGT